MSILRRDRVTLEGALEMFDLPRWTLYVFLGLPAIPAIAVAARGDTGLPWPVGVALLAVALLTIGADEFLPPLSEGFLGFVGLAALTPIILAGGDRLVLAIAWFIVMQGTTFGSGPESVAVLIGGEALVVAAGAVEPGLPSAPFVLAVMVVAWLAGSGARQILRLLARMHDAEALLATEAAREERRKLAREVHDVIAHSMTVTLLHVNGARLALRDEPESADQALLRAERVGRASLEDLRRTVKLLSEASDPTPGTSVELGGDLARLRDGFAGSGTDIALRVDGDAESVPPFIGLTVFRIVQESLTNAVRHSSGACVHVAVVVGEERITLRVENSMGDTAPKSSGQGRGLRGMFERASLVGGHVEAGPTKDGWLVTGWVPLEAPPAGVEA